MESNHCFSQTEDLSHSIMVPKISQTLFRRWEVRSKIYKLDQQIDSLKLAPSTAGKSILKDLYYRKKKWERYDRLLAAGNQTCPFKDALDNELKTGDLIIIQKQLWETKSYFTNGNPTWTCNSAAYVCLLGERTPGGSVRHYVLHNNSMGYLRNLQPYRFRKVDEQMLTPKEKNNLNKLIKKGIYYGGSRD